jgi:hypothetical protein
VNSSYGEDISNRKVDEKIITPLRVCLSGWELSRGVNRSHHHHFIIIFIQSECESFKYRSIFF